MTSETISADEYNALVATKKAPKYGNRKTTVDGIVFDSAAEARRYGELRLLESQGAIVGLALQPKFDLMVNGQKIGEYRADFLYYEVSPSGKVCDPTVEDVKGMRTPVYRLKAKLMKACHGITVRETE